MFSKVTLFAVAAMAAFVAAAPSPADGGIENSCNTGPVQCCDQTYESNSDEANLLHSIFGLVLGPVGTQVGVQCSPATVAGIGSGSSCSSKPVCCTDNGFFGGLISSGCSPITVKGA